jgi:hypothetical protein
MRMSGGIARPRAHSSAMYSRIVRWLTRNGDRSVATTAPFSRPVNARFSASGLLVSGA